MAVNSLFVLMCRYTHYVKVYPLGGVWVNHQPKFAFDAPLGVGFRHNIAVTFGTEKLEWCGYLKVKIFEDMFTRFDRMHVRT